jgi:hypothetical protein
MNLFLITLVVMIGVAASTSSDEDAKFEAHKRKYGKVYKNATEHALRKQLYLTCLKEAAAENAKGNSFTVECREHADKTEEEKKSLLGLIPPEHTLTKRDTATTTTASTTTTTTLPPAPPSVG